MARIASPLSDTQIKNAKPKDNPYKLADGGGLYLEVMPTGKKLWRMKYQQASGKESRLSFGTHPAVSLLQARKKRDAARELKAAGTDPGQLKRDEKQAKAVAAANTFELVAWAWLEKTSATRAATTNDKITSWLKRDVFPFIDTMPVANIRAMNVLAPAPFDKKLMSQEQTRERNEGQAAGLGDASRGFAAYQDVRPGADDVATETRHREIPGPIGVGQHVGQNAVSDDVGGFGGFAFDVEHVPVGRVGETGAERQYRCQKTLNNV